MEIERVQEMDIQHFSHRHTLSFLKSNDRKTDMCRVCGLIVSESCYYCERCYFYIHSSCAKLPREMEHHFHSKHKLTLLAQSPYTSGIFRCNACGMDSEGFTYNCLECRFDLDINCAALMPTKGKTSHIHQKKYRHPHPLFICDQDSTSYYNFLCSCCDLPVPKDGLIFVCLECQIVLDESCVGLRQEIQHPFHPLHLLTLSSGECECSVCGKKRKGLSFRCSTCAFYLDFRCASLVLTTNENKEQDQQIQCVTNHSHQLIHCSKPKKSLPILCSGCLLPLHEDQNDSTCVCLDCKIVLHESCARLPHKIEHPFHPTHRLTLINTIDRPKFFECKACLNFCAGFIYRCQKCSFQLDIRCAFPDPLFINSEFHQHPLAFFNCKEDNLYCNCCLDSCKNPFFRCVECNFTIHFHCIRTLPPIVNHKCHLHSLTLTNPPIKDHEDEEDDSEFYCDACEEQRQLWEPTYYCKECHYVAHVHCVVSEVLPNLRRQSLLGDRLSAKKLDKTWEELQRDPRESREKLTNAIQRDGRWNGNGDSSVHNFLADPSLATINEEIADLERLNRRMSYLRKRRAQLLFSLLHVKKVKGRNMFSVLSQDVDIPLRDHTLSEDEIPPPFREFPEAGPSHHPSSVDVGREDPSTPLVVEDDTLEDELEEGTMAPDSPISNRQKKREAKIKFSGSRPKGRHIS